VTRALAVVSDLGVPDALAGGPRAVRELAESVGADRDTLHRLLRALASDGVFAEVAPGVFSNTALSDLLRGPWGAGVHLMGDAVQPALGRFGADGVPAFPATFGTDFWTWLSTRPDERATFDRSMEEGTERQVEHLAAAGWRGDETVVDVGGGNGSLLVALLRRRPGLRGVVYDRPETARDDDALRAAGCTFVAGSFFDIVPPGDVYVLSTVLHDWDDESAERILRTIRAAAEDDARLLVLDAVIPPGNAPHPAKWLDLIVLAMFAGRERDAAQWRALLRASGWEPVAIDDGLIEARCR
jgi:hypothetical protein